jgi:hypothetical protein
MEETVWRIFMSQLIRLVYASQSNSPARLGSVDPVVGSILSQSRRNNSRDQIGGVLYYGDGFFFQCLEGERSQVEAVYERIRGDMRHREPRILRLQSVNCRMFSEWSMKYVPAEQDVRSFLELKGIEAFNPYNFSENLIDELVTFFHQVQLPVSLEVEAAVIQRKPSSLDNSAAIDAKKAGFWKRVADAFGLRKSA